MTGLSTQQKDPCALIGVNVDAPVDLILLSRQIFASRLSCSFKSNLYSYLRIYKSAVDNFSRLLCSDK